MCKKMFYLSSLILVLVIGAAAQAGIVEWEAAISGANPLHWYKFDEAGADCIDSGSGGLNGVYDGVVMGAEGLFGPGTAVGFERSGANRADFANATDMPGPWTVEYIVKTTKAAAANDSQALHDSDATSIRLAGWTALGEVGFTLYGVADYRFTPIAGYTLDDLIIKQDEWVHLTWRNDGAGTQFFLNGKLVGTSTDMIDLPRLRIGGRGGGPADHLMGVLDEAVVFDRALSDEDIVAHSDASTLLDPSVLGAGNPDPADEATHAATWVSLAWSAGGTAISHDVYLADNFDDVDQGTGDAFRGNQATTTFIAGFVGFPYPDGLVPGTTYYWRVDEIDPETTHRGQIWSFLVPPRTAYNPVPADGAKFMAEDVTLSWTGGFDAKLHTVYFGDNFDNVNDATGGLPQSTVTFTPAGPLAKDTTYYWRVDEFDAATTHKGDVWSFRTLPDIPVTDPSLLAWWTLDEGAGTNVLDWSGHGHHGSLGEDAGWTDGYDLTAVQFDGRGDYVGFGTPADLYLPDTYTYTAWFKPGEDIRGDSGPQYLLCIGSRSDLVFGVEDGVGVNGDLSLHYYDTQPSFHAVGVGQTSWHADEWHMVAGTRDATGHKIYLDGELRNFDTNVNQDNFGGATGRMISLGARAWTGHQYFNGTIDDVRIYNKALTDQEILEVMEGNTLVAGDPEPARGATLDITDVTSLSFSAGDGAASHDVYFGTDRSAVAGADNSSPEFQGNQAGTSLSAAGLVEFGGGDYYWRVDEVAAGGTVTAGTIWKFTVTDYLTVDDIESYNDLPEDDPESNRIYLVWIDGFGTTTNGAQVGNLDVPLTERSNVHGGLQAMPYSYDNNLKTSEGTLTLTRRDWTAEGVTRLSLWFRGDAANTAERMFVALNGTAVVYHDDASVTQITKWTEWVIDLTEFAGVDLTNVNTITIGFGTKNAPAAGGSGQMYFDDIRLYRPASE
ncbi:MAG: hypothetical protein AMJ65_06065 [Phycisphaerae bacterium SG8_4]|nr:MAG: hypothetical protein AMJ65_06065 [Phycisphaerae bacterium SG8_4]